MSIPVVGSIMACMMAGCRLVEEPPAANANVWPFQMPNACSAPEGCWAGKSRIAECAGPFDCIHAPAKSEASGASKKRRLESNAASGSNSNQKTLKQLGW